MRGLIVSLGASIVVAIAMVGPAFARTKTAPPSDRDTLALVNGSPIMAAEFKKRFQLSIYPHKEIESELDIEKERFLFSMIAERLLSDEAIKEGKILTEEARQLEHEAADTYLRDALYREKILSKVHVTANEVARGSEMLNIKYKIDVHYFPDSLSVDGFFSQSLHLETSQLDSLVREYRIRVDTMSVSYGNLVDREEEAFWGHKKGFISDPIKGGNTSLDLSIDTAKAIALDNKRQEVLARYVASLVRKGT